MRTFFRKARVKPLISHLSEPPVLPLGPRKSSLVPGNRSSENFFTICSPTLSNVYQNIYFHLKNVVYV